MKEQAPAEPNPIYLFKLPTGEDVIAEMEGFDDEYLLVQVLHPCRVRYVVTEQGDLVLGLNPWVLVAPFSRSKFTFNQTMIMGFVEVSKDVGTGYNEYVARRIEREKEIMAEDPGPDLSKDEQFQRFKGMLIHDFEATANTAPVPPKKELN